MTPSISPKLQELRTHFQARGLDIRLVGGCVRDMLMQQTPKDVDLCTDATPDEQIEIYQSAGLHFIPTGLAHGTITVMLDGEGYEITSLRTESEHDGRHAVVAFTRDWTEDLSRRDLTINAISMTFDGQIHDPFGGQQDIENKVVRFVGNAEERMREDYLRIMRYFRFLGRMAGDSDQDYDNYGKITIDAVTMKAISVCASGLRDISAERIWVEMKKIISHPAAFVVLKFMKELNVFEHARIPESLDPDEVHDAGVSMGETDAMTILARCLQVDEIKTMARDLKWSTEELAWCLEFKRMQDHTAEELFREIILNGTRVDFAVQVARKSQYHYIATLMEQPLPVCPVNGDVLRARGVKPGPEMGTMLRDIKKRWYETGCRATAEELMNDPT